MGRKGSYNNKKLAYNLLRGNLSLRGRRGQMRRCTNGTSIRGGRLRGQNLAPFFCLQLAKPLGYKLLMTHEVDYGVKLVAAIPLSTGEWIRVKKDVPNNPFTIND